MITFEWMSVSQLLLQGLLFSTAIYLLQKTTRLSPRLFYLLWYALLLRHLFPFQIVFQPGILPDALPGFIPLLPEIESAPDQTITLLNLLPILWVSAVGIILVTLLLNEFRFKRSLDTIPAPEELRHYLPRANTTLSIQISDRHSAPFIYGIWKPVLVLPVAMLTLPERELRAIFAHECHHLQRRDNLHKLLHTLISVLWFFSPAVWIARRQCDDYQELFCDIHSLKTSGLEARHYAQTLLNAAAGRYSVPVSFSLALSRIDGGKKSLRQRLIFLNKHYRKEFSMQLKKMHILVLGIFIALMAAAACQSSEAEAPTFNTEPAGELSQQASLNKNSDDSVKFIPYDVPPMMIGGGEALAANIKYPEKAREAKIEGTVIVQAFVNEQGVPEKFKLMKSIPNTGLDEAAIDAIRNTRFEPAKQKDKNVGVWIAIPIIFKLQ
jgi:TonB family protein